MSQVPVWFERKFEFSFPVELLPNLCARLRGTPARLEEVLRGRSRETLIAKPQEKWSAQEHAGHLLDLEPLWLARVRLRRRQRAAYADRLAEIEKPTKQCIPSRSWSGLWKQGHS